MYPLGYKINTIMKAFTKNKSRVLHMDPEKCQNSSIKTCEGINHNTIMRNGECTYKTYTIGHLLLVSSLQSAIRVTIEFPLIFGKTNFVEVPKIHKIHKICSPGKKAPYGTLHEGVHINVLPPFPISRYLRLISSDIWVLAFL